MKNAAGYYRTNGGGEKPVIGRGSGLTIRELNRKIDDCLKRRGIDDTRPSDHPDHIWKRGRAHRGAKNEGNGLKSAPKVPKAFVRGRDAAVAKPGGDEGVPKRGDEGVAATVGDGGVAATVGDEGVAATATLIVPPRGPLPALPCPAADDLWNAL